MLKLLSKGCKGLSVKWLLVISHQARGAFGSTQEKVRVGSLMMLKRSGGPYKLVLGYLLVELLLLLLLLLRCMMMLCDLFGALVGVRTQGGGGPSQVKGLLLLSSCSSGGAIIELKEGVRKV